MNSFASPRAIWVGCEGPLGEFQIVHKGGQLTYSDTSVSNGTEYYYTIYSYDSFNNYSDSVIARETANPRTTYPYYRFVVDSVIGDGSNRHTNCRLDTLELQIDGEWASSYDFTSAKGLVDGNPVTVSESSLTGSNSGWNVFAAGQWVSAQDVFSTSQPRDAVSPNSTYLEFDFSSNPLGLSGWRGSSSGKDPAFYKSPDGVHMQRSSDGSTWIDIDDSLSTDVMIVPVQRQW